MKVLVWQWGRRGAGPLVAASMARELGAVPGVETMLSLSTTAELLRLAEAPANGLPMRTYDGKLGFVSRALSSPWLVPQVARALRAARVDAALCAMPAPLDFVMAAAARRAGLPYAVVVHDAQLHPGDAFPMQMALQRGLLRRASALFALSSHVAQQLRAQGLQRGQPLLLSSLPPFRFGAAPAAGSHGGRLRLLSFGRLMPYKGLDLLADVMERLRGHAGLELRVVGSGPEGGELERLRGLPNVTVENRWVPERELGALLGWADALVLTHREASQSGVAAAAIATRRWIVSTRVGGLDEQLRDNPMAMLCAPDAESLAAAIGSLPGRIAAGPPASVAGPDWRAEAEAVAAGLSEMVRRGGTAAPSPAGRVAAGL